ncbi:hypothetical protein [Streptomyces sp. NPDC088847]
MQLVELISAVIEMDEAEAERLADGLLGQLGLYGLPPQVVAAGTDLRR